MYQGYQYHSEGTQQPTITLGNQYDPQRLRGQPKNNMKQHNRHDFPPSEHSQHLRLQYEKQLQICLAQIQALKEQVQLDEKEKMALEETIAHLKKERSAADNQSRRLFQENQKNRQLVQKLKIDNRSMEMEIDKFRSQRKVYYSNLNNIQALKRDISTQLAEKNTLIDQLSAKLRKVERTHSDCRFRIEQQQKELCETEKQKQQLRQELKLTLQKYLSNGNILTKLEYQLKQVNQLNKNLKDRVYDLEKEREELLIKLGYDISASKQNMLSESNRSNYPSNQRSMIEIQSYMKEVGNLLDLKRDDMEKRRKNYEKLRISIECLQSHL